MSEIRDGRFAPSPTGALHVGNLRTALLAWLFARGAHDPFYVRLEDLDVSRVRPGVAEAQLADLAALGLDWDGAVVRQSERTELYAEALAGLEAAGRVYPCWCTRAEIAAAASAPHGALPEGAYPGTCAELSTRQRAARAQGGRPPALRLRAHAEEATVADRLHGPVTGVVDDFVLRRNDGAFGYQLAVVVDDAAQGIGEVVRGDDLLDSAPRQALLARLLGLPAVSWAHVPLVLGPDGRRLAKRHGAVTLAERRARGESAAEIRSTLAASAGLCEPGERPSPAELVSAFDPARLGREPTVFADQRPRPRR